LIVNNGESDLNGKLDVSSDVKVHGDTDLKKTTVHGNSNEINLIVTGKSDLNGDLDVEGDTNVSGNTNLAKTTT